MGESFKPSQVFLDVVPLIATMQKAEVELAAALIVRACQLNGDTWAPLSWEVLRNTIMAEYEAKRQPVLSWMNQPFINPDFFLLAERGFAVKTGEPSMTTFAFTEVGLEAMRRWVREAVANG